MWRDKGGKNGLWREYAHFQEQKGLEIIVRMWYNDLHIGTLLKG